MKRECDAFLCLIGILAIVIGLILMSHIVNEVPPVPIHYNVSIPGYEVHVYGNTVVVARNTTVYTFTLPETLRNVAVNEGGIVLSALLIALGLSFIMMAVL